MLKPAIQYADEITEMFKEVWFEDKYKYWNAVNYYDKFVIKDSTYDGHQFVSIKNDRVIGYIGYTIDRSANIVTSISIVNFYDQEPKVFAADLMKALKDIFELYKFHKILFYTVVGNPAEKAYDNIVKKIGGRIVGVYKDDVKLIDGEYYDRKDYEIMASDYFTHKRGKTKV